MIVCIFEHVQYAWRWVVNDKLADDSQAPVWNCSFRVDVFEVCTALVGPHNASRCAALLRAAAAAGRQLQNVQMTLSLQ